MLPGNPWPPFFTVAELKQLKTVVLWFLASQTIFVMLQSHSSTNKSLTSRRETTDMDVINVKLHLVRFLEIILLIIYYYIKLYNNIIYYC